MSVKELTILFNTGFSTNHDVLVWSMELLRCLCPSPFNDKRFRKTDACQSLENIILKMSDSTLRNIYIIYPGAIVFESKFSDRAPGIDLS